MNKHVLTKQINNSYFSKSIMEGLSQMDSKTIIILGGMASVSLIICVGLACFSGSEMTVSKSGLTIKQPLKT